MLSTNCVNSKRKYIRGKHSASVTTKLVNIVKEIFVTMFSSAQLGNKYVVTNVVFCYNNEHIINKYYKFIKFS